jgi:hypothetical protein
LKTLKGLTPRPRQFQHPQRNVLAPLSEQTDL